MRCRDQSRAETDPEEPWSSGDWRTTWRWAGEVCVNPLHRVLTAMDEFGHVKTAQRALLQRAPWCWPQRALCSIRERYEFGED